MDGEEEAGVEGKLDDKTATVVTPYKELSRREKWWRRVIKVLGFLLQWWP